MVKATSLLINAGIGHGFSFGVRTWIEMEIWCVKGMCGIKVVCSKKKRKKKGLKDLDMFQVYTWQKCSC